MVDYIADRFEQTGKEISAAALQLLLELVDGHPQRAMVAAHTLWDFTHKVADLEEWEEARIAIMDRVADEMKVTWSGLSGTERHVLVAVSRGGGSLSAGWVRVARWRSRRGVGAPGEQRHPRSPRSAMDGDRPVARRSDPLRT
jgi:hypothetical protein